MYSNPAYEMEDRARYRGAAGTVEKTRDCLKCESAFISQWFGQRICQKCKRSPDWRAGLPPGLI